MEDNALLSRKTAKDPSPAASAECITIDKGVPMPPESKRKPYEGKYPWRQMSPGDSFVYPIAKGDVRYTYFRAQSMVRQRVLTQGEKYEVRTVEEDGQRVVRVWRTA